MRLLLTALLVSVALGAQEQERPLYRAGRTLDPITIDGKADEVTWSARPGVGPFENVRGPVAAAPTRSVVAWDDDNLYVMFSCVDEHAWGTLHKRDDPLWGEEVVEVFLDPDGDGRNYAELEISPHNVVVDLLIPAPGEGGKFRKDWDFEGLRSAVDLRQGSGWTVEIAIPWKSLADTGVTRAPQPGDRWRVGLYRIERPGGATDPETNRQYLAWSRTERHFHEPQRFGVIEFALRP